MVDELHDIPTENILQSDQRSASDFPCLAVDAIIGQYRIVQIIADGQNTNEYLVRVASDDNDISSPQEPFLRVIEGPQGSLEAIRSIEYLQLRHPRLLALREFFTADARDYIVIDIPDKVWPIAPILTLMPAEALATGIMIGEVLAYLHVHGIAMDHITPDNICITANGVFLKGIEYAHGTDTSGEFIRKNVNELAATLRILAEQHHEPANTDAALQVIANKGKSESYTELTALLTECLHALPDGLPKLAEDASTKRMTLKVGHATTVGMIRSQNQDAIGIMHMEIFDDLPHASPGGIYLIADGMGGEAQGEVASRIAVRVIVGEVARRFLGPVARASASDLPAEAILAGETATTVHVDSISALIDAYRAANSRIRNLARRLEKAAGTTATSLVIYNHDVIIGHVGDSRAYILRNDELHQLTNDHSLLQKMIESGVYRPEEAESMVPRNYLYRSLGQGDDLEVDTRVLTIGVGDTLMICSDGLWDMLSDHEIRAILIQQLSPETLAKELVEQANIAGGHDNSSAIVIQCVAYSAL